MGKPWENHGKATGKLPYIGKAYFNGLVGMIFTARPGNLAPVLLDVPEKCPLHEFWEKVAESDTNIYNAVKALQTWKSTILQNHGCRSICLWVAICCYPVNQPF